MSPVEYLGFGFAFLGFLIALAVWRRSISLAKAAQAVQDEMAESLREKMNAHAAAERRANKLDSEMTSLQRTTKRLESELAQALERRDEKRIARAMWNLELERSYRQWKDVLSPTVAQRGGGVTSGMQLNYALGQEVERLREEVGVLITFSGNVSRDLEPEVALGMLRINEELLAVAGKRADEIVVEIIESPLELRSVLTNSGWDDYDEADSTEIIRSVEKMADRMGGAFTLDNSQDQLIMTTSISLEPQTDEGVVERDDEAVAETEDRADDQVDAVNDSSLIKDDIDINEENSEVDHSNSSQASNH